MALTIGQKCVRVLRFLRGAVEPRTYGALAAHGFNQAELEEGWTLLRSASGNKLLKVPVVNTQPETYEELDQWENKWFPICRPSLERRHPAVAARVFLNLMQTNGLEVSISVGTFTRRIRELEQSSAPEDKEARALLNKRGLTEGVLKSAEDLLARLEVAPTEPEPQPDPKAIAAAEQAMWAWYLEWSVIARNVVHTRRQLRALGFLTSAGAVVTDDEPSEEEPPEEGLSETAA